ncbi:MAG: MGMT family protein [Solirubrobacteraceae bacterium]
MPLFEVDHDTRRVTEIRPTTFPALRLWERQDLEAWVLSSPDLAGGDFTVVTSEFDRFDQTAERLDVLGVVALEPGRARLVVVELKRDGTSTTVDLQAIKYAAYVAACNFDDVVNMYGRHHDVDEAHARETLLELLGGSEDEPPTIDDTPRIVLVAGDFRPEVTTTVLWLVDNSELDVRCVRLQPFTVGTKTLVHSEILIPLPEAEQYRLGLQRKRKETKLQQERSRAGRLLPRLVGAGALQVGQQLLFRRDAVPGDDPAWSGENALFRAELVAAEGNRTMAWTDPDTGELLKDSPSRLAARVLHRLGLRTGELSSAGVNGMHYWTVDGETSLRDLGGEAGLLDHTGRHIDRDALRELCRQIPEGHWTTYGDVATGIGVSGAFLSVASVIASDASVPNPHRVVRASGQVSPGFRAADGAGGPEVARARLAEEGLTFTANGAADPARRWVPSPTAA